MIMDEVLAVGDVAFQRKCIERMRMAAQQEGRTVLYVSHNMDTIQRLCKRCVVLSDGKILFDGDVSRAIEFYLGSSDTMFTRKEYAEKDHESRFYSNRFSVRSFELPEGRIPEYTAGEPMTFQLLCEAAEDIDRLSMHFIVMCGAKPVGSYLPERQQRFARGRHLLRFTVDTSLLTEGSYTMKFVMHSNTDYGSIERLDIIESGFNFVILDRRADADYPVWEPATWGRARLPRMQVMTLDENDGPPVGKQVHRNGEV